MIISKFIFKSSAIVSLFVASVDGQDTDTARLISRHLNPNRPEILPRNVPSVDRGKVKTEDAEREARGEPMRFAVSHDLAVDTKNDGTWENTDNGTQVWRYRLKSPGCNSMNFGFCEYEMPKGGSLHVYDNKGKTAISRSFTTEDNKGGQLWTPIIESCDVILEVNLPVAASADDLKLSLCSANIGYRGFGTKPEKEHGKPRRELSGSCNVDVVCSDGDDWRDEISSVAAISTGGNLFCSGAMINNANQDRKPLFLTAYHCGIRSNNAASLVTYWNYESSSCGGPTNGSLSQFTTGATLLAGSQASDFTLVQLNSDPDPLYEVSFAGWDRSGDDAATAVAIHHPSVDEKRISFENQPTTTTNYGGTAVRVDGTHVRVIDWDIGTTEGGSSGSPLFDQNHRIIGQLHGGGAACGNDLSDWYGRVYVSWTAGLSDHLDPSNTGAVTVNTLSSDGTSTPTSSSQPSPAPPEYAQFDGAFGTPRCSAASVACSTGDLTAKMASTETNAPNSLDSCSDGASGTYEVDESVESIEVTSVGGGELQAGAEAVVKATVYAYDNGSEDTADFYFTSNPANPNWSLIGSISATAGGFQTLTSPAFVLPDSSIAAVRVNFRYQGNPSSCSGGNYDDIDDLVFSISQSSPDTESPTKSPSKNPTNSPTKSPTDSPTQSVTESPTKSPSKTPTNSPTKSPTESPTKSPSKTPTNSPSKSPTDSPTQIVTESPTKSPAKTPTNSPSKSPTDSPTSAVTPSPTNAPSVSNGCDGMSITVDVLTDNYPLETSWLLINSCTGVAQEFKEQESYNQVATEYSDTYCVPQAEYIFQISDSANDGICCGQYGDGSYMVTSDGVSVASGGVFGSSETSAAFGSNSGGSLCNIVATHDADMGAPKCSAAGISCTTGSLLQGVASSETNSPNTINNSCNDGTSGSYLSDESIERITVTALGDGELQAGGIAEIEAVVWAWSTGSSDTADFYYAADASNPDWEFIESKRPSGGDEQSIKVQYQLPPSSALQAVRVNFRYAGNRSPCSGGNYDDTDDLIFSVAVGGPVPADAKLSGPVPDLKPLDIDCELIGKNEDRCEAASPMCHWQQTGRDRGCHSHG